MATKDTMSHTQTPIENHYGRGQILDSILAALRKSGKDPARLIPADLAPVDEFHIRGREATLELARRAALTPGIRVLDIGCGLGGSARYLATEHQCQVIGIDLTREYVDVANALADLVGLGQKVAFRQASALALPFDDASFDVVWTEHVQMNIADKHAFYSEIHRVTRGNGLLLFHDVFSRDETPVHYPVPWAEDASMSFLVSPREARELLGELGFSIEDWDDRSEASLDWFLAAIRKLKESGPTPLGLQLLMGSTAKTKSETLIRNLREKRLAVIQALAKKR